MMQTDFRRSDADADADADAELEESTDLLPSRAPQRYSKAAIIDVAAVLIGTLGEQSDESRASVNSALKSYHLQMAMARTWLENSHKENSYLFLVAPPGASAERRWVDLACEIERNELICRKLVWLPKVEEDTWIGGASFFCERVFSMPFADTVANAAVQELDPLGRIFGEGAFPALWLDILLRAPDGGDAVVRELIDALRAEGGE
jgi:hypothetical protein